jgi:hypothetical protein
MPQLTLCEQRALMSRAIRTPIAATAASGAAGEPVLYRTITAALAGVNTLIEAQPGIIEILQMEFWNTAAQTISLYDGPNLLQTLPAFPAMSGRSQDFAYGLTPYYSIAKGNAFIVNLAVGTRFDGFCNYRVKAA